MKDDLLMFLELRGDISDFNIFIQKITLDGSTKEKISISTFLYKC